MAREYLSMEDVKLRLHKTVCLHKGEPVYVLVEDLGRNHEVYCTPLAAAMTTNKGGKYVDYRTGEFDYKYIPLGYIQYKHNAYYLSRLPERKNHQGLKSDVIHSTPDICKEYPQQYWFFHSSMVDCIKGKHMPMKEAVDKILFDGWQSAAVHRYFAVAKIDAGNKVGLYYKEQLIGIKEPHSYKFNMIESRGSSFIQKVMEQAQIT